MIFSLPLVFFALLLTLGQGRVALRSMKEGRAGWGRYTYQRASDPARYKLMVVVEVLLFVGLCAWFGRGVSELLS